MKGACIVYDTRTYRRHMFLNPTKFDYVQTVFINRLNDELILVTYRQHEHSNILQCRSISLPYRRYTLLPSALESKDIQHSRILFDDDLFLAPSYFEFDEFNEVIITYSASKQYLFLRTLK